MTLLITLTMTGIAGYLKMTLSEEVEAVSAGLVACLGLFLSLFFAPMLIKLALLIILLAYPKISNYKKTPDTIEN